MVPGPKKSPSAPSGISSWFRLVIGVVVVQAEIRANAGDKGRGRQRRVGRAAAEFELGAGRPYHSVLGVFWGTGVGGGLILDGGRSTAAAAPARSATWSSSGAGAAARAERGLHGGLRRTCGDGGPGTQADARGQEVGAAEDHAREAARAVHERRLGRRVEREDKLAIELIEDALKRSAPVSPRRSTCSTSKP